MKKYLPALVAGFAAGVMHVVPLAKSLTCCLIVPLAAFFAIVLDSKANKITSDFELKRGATLGLLTGLFAAFFGSFFDILVTFITHHNDIITTINELPKVIDSVPVSEELKDEIFKIMTNIATSIEKKGFSEIYAMSIFFNNIVVNTIFGLIGGLVGTKIFNTKNS
ncbi:MAG: hypothetical protein CR986_04525 [Ignavibacteriae bacterium]|nr:MAG: hypothetical protein CR986_04525 [Ignavibacteriota bacterium]